MMLAFIFDTISFFRSAYIVLCIVVGACVVFGIFRNACKKLWYSTNLYKKIKREEMRKWAAQDFPESSHIQFADGRAQNSVSDRDR